MINSFKKSITIVILSFCSLKPVLFIIPDYVSETNQKENADSQIKMLKRVFITPTEKKTTKMFDWNDVDFLKKVFVSLKKNLSSPYEEQVDIQYPLMTEDSFAATGISTSAINPSSSEETIQPCNSPASNSSPTHISRATKVARLNALIDLESFENLLEKENISISEKRLLASVLLTYYILGTKKDNQPSDEPIYILGVGVHGSQIAHIVSNLLGTGKRESALSFIIGMALMLSGNPEIAVLVRSIMSGIETVASAKRTKILADCSQLLKCNMAMLESAKNIIHSIYNNFKLPPVKIDKLYTVGSTFINGSFLPNFESIDGYINFYSKRDVTGSFAHNELTQNTFAGKEPITRSSSLSSRIINVSVSEEVENYSCCRMQKTRNKYLNHNQLLINERLYVAIRYFFFQSFFPHKMPYIFTKFKISNNCNRDIRLDSVNPNTLSTSVRKFCQNLFCCGCCYNKNMFWEDY